LTMTLLPFVFRILKIDVNDFNMAGLLLIPVVIFHVVLTYLTPAPDREKIDHWLWKPSMLWPLISAPQARYRWYRRLSLWWAILFVVYLALYVVFW